MYADSRALCTRENNPRVAGTSRINGELLVVSCSIS